MIESLKSEAQKIDSKGVIRRAATSGYTPPAFLAIVFRPIFFPVLLRLLGSSGAALLGRFPLPFQVYHIFGSV